MSAVLKSKALEIKPKKMTETLKISNLHVAVGGKPILHGVNLTIRRGETHALMGPNGSGKSTLAGVIMGHPNFEVTEGTIELNGQNIMEWDATERARAGIFMAFQRPMAIPGVKMADFLRHAASNVRNRARAGASSSTSNARKGALMGGLRFPPAAK